MRNLLGADWKRLWKEKVFLLGLAFMLFGSAFFSYLNYQTALQRPDEVLYVEDVLFNLFPMIGVVSAIVIAFFLGEEYDHGTIRNKLIVGHKRMQIYLSDLMVCTGGTLILLFAMLSVSGVIGYLFFRSFLLPPSQLVYLLWCAVLVSMVFAAIYTAIAMRAPSRAIGIVICWAVFYGMMMLSSFVASCLAEQEMMYSYVSVTQAGVEFGDLIENPAYIAGFQRTVYEFINDLLPTGQTAMLNNMEFERIERWPWLSVLMWITGVLLGWMGFRKRDIK